MLNRERKRADDAEERLAEERKRSDERLAEERKRNDALLEEFHAERIQNRAAQQEILSRIADTQAILVQLLQQRQNGNGRPAAED